MPSRASSSSRQNVPSTSTRSLAAKPGEHAVVEPRQPGHVGDDPAARAVAEDEPARLQLDVGPVQIARRIAARRRTDSTVRLDPSSGQRAPRLERLPLGPAVALQHLQHGIAASSARARRPRCRTRAPASPDSRSSSSPAVWSISASVSRTPAIGAARTPSARRRERLELLTRVGRGVDEKPRPVVPADRQRGLRARSRAHAGARGLARLAMAVPLREPSAGGRAENTNAHVAEEG